MSQATVQEMLFYRNLLFGVRLERECFHAEGKNFHQAFGKVMEVAQEFAPEKYAGVRAYADPIFGTYPEAELMINEGIADLILVLDAPRLEHARIDMSKEEAQSELLREEHSEYFRILGKYFAAQLDRCA